MTDINDSGIREYRDKIDIIDADIAHLLEERLSLVKGISSIKEKEGLPVLDVSRQQEKLLALRSLCSSEAQPYIEEVFRQIMAGSRAYQQGMRQDDASLQAGEPESCDEPSYGLLGRKLTHSYSPRIHRLIGSYDFGLLDLEPDQLDAFFREGRFRGITVTMPYKRAVMKYCSELSETAVKCGSVNTIIKRPDGTYFGDNTDYYGFRSTVLSSGVEVKGKKAIVFGSGGVSGTVVRVLEELGAEPVVVISRRAGVDGRTCSRNEICIDSYENLKRHRDARVVVNATPVGMYPNAGEAVIDIQAFPACEAVFDLIYNPLRTKLMLDAADAGVPAFCGLHMLVAQAAKAYQLFCTEYPDLAAGRSPDPAALTQRACRQLRWEVENIVLIGMPGCGKTTIGKRIAEITGKAFVDCDEKVAEVCGRSPEEIIRAEGIERFRDIEESVVKQVLRSGAGGAQGIIFATGGGCVESEGNRVPLLENSLVVYLERDLSQLPVDGRPVSQMDGLEAVHARRQEIYEQWCDVHVSKRQNLSFNASERTEDKSEETG